MWLDIPCSLCSLDFVYSFKCLWWEEVSQLVIKVWNKNQSKYKSREDSYGVLYWKKKTEKYSLCEYTTFLTEVTDKQAQILMVKD